MIYMLSSDSLKRMIYTELRQSGFKFKRNELIPPNLKNKNAIRRAHKPAKLHLLLKNKNWILENEKYALDFFANGEDIRPSEIHPKLILVDDEEKSKLFRYASYLWGIPLSSGFGRRLRYLVMDSSNNKLIGIFGLTDPVIAIRTRDSWIGWDREQKERMLWHVMDAFAFGAVQPYNYLLGGKLIATLMTSEEVRKDFKKKYSHGRSVISGKNYKTRKPYLVLVTTTGAYGESSILDRLKFQDRLLWPQLGFTEGWGFFHLNNGIATKIYEDLKTVNDPIVKQHRFGEGPNWKMRLIRYYLEKLDLNYEKYGKHGVKRGFYAAPLAENFREFLNGEDKRPKFYKQSTEELFEFFRARYLLSRSERDLRWKDFNNNTISLMKMLKNL